MSNSEQWPRLRRSPLREVLIELRYAAEDWDWTIPGMLYDRISEVYPTKQNVALGVLASDSVASSVGPRGIRFSGENGLAVQVGPKQLHFSQSGAYSDWSVFKDEFLRVLMHHDAIAKYPIERLALRYINAFQIPKATFPLEEFFKFHPAIPDSEDPSTMVNFRVQVDGQLETPPGRLRAHLHPGRGGKEGGEPGIILDIQALTIAPDLLSYDNDVGRWLGDAHQRIKEFFFRSITQATLQMLEPE